MPIHAKPTHSYADLGDAWLRGQTARIQQRHLQFGRRCRIDLDALLSRAAREVRAFRGVEKPVMLDRRAIDISRRATIDAIDHCQRLEADRTVHAAAAIAA